MTKPKCELQPCGHPVCAIRGLPDFPGDEDREHTQYCGWCADIEWARDAGERQGTIDTIKALMNVDRAIP